MGLSSESEGFLTHRKAAGLAVEGPVGILLEDPDDDVLHAGGGQGSLRFREQGGAEAAPLMGLLDVEGVDLPGVAGHGMADGAAGGEAAQTALRFRDQQEFSLASGADAFLPMAGAALLRQAVEEGLRQDAGVSLAPGGDLDAGHLGGVFGSGWADDHADSTG